MLPYPSMEQNDNDNLTGLLRRMEQIDEMIASGALDSSIAMIAEDYLNRAKEEFGRANYDLSNEFLMNAERVCS